MESPVCRYLTLIDSGKTVAVAMPSFDHPLWRQLPCEQARWKPLSIINVCVLRGASSALSLNGGKVGLPLALWQESSQILRDYQR